MMQALQSQGKRKAGKILARSSGIAQVVSNFGQRPPLGGVDGRRPGEEQLYLCPRRRPTLAV